MGQSSRPVATYTSFCKLCSSTSSASACDEIQESCHCVTVRLMEQEKVKRDEVINSCGAAARPPARAAGGRGTKHRERRPQKPLKGFYHDDQSFLIVQERTAPTRSLGLTFPFSPPFPHLLFCQELDFEHFRHGNNKHLTLGNKTTPRCCYSKNCYSSGGFILWVLLQCSTFAARPGCAGL